MFAVRNAPNEALRAALASGRKLDDEYAAARALGEQRSSYALPGLHSFRWTVLAPRNERRAAEAAARRVCDLSMVFDGERATFDRLYEKMNRSCRDPRALPRLQPPATANELPITCYRRARERLSVPRRRTLLDGDPRGLDATRRRSNNR